MNLWKNGKIEKNACNFTGVFLDFSFRINYHKVTALDEQL